MICGCNGTWDLDQTRTATKVNEITDITESAGPSWGTPVYNRAGNMTTIPKPADPTQSFTATYDGWNRLVRSEEGANKVAEYEHDCAKPRTVKKNYVSGQPLSAKPLESLGFWKLARQFVEQIGRFLFLLFGLRVLDVAAHGIPQGPSVLRVLSVFQVELSRTFDRLPVKRTCFIALAHGVEQSGELATKAAEQSTVSESTSVRVSTSWAARWACSGLIYSGVPTICWIFV